MPSPDDGAVSIENIHPTLAVDEKQVTALVHRVVAGEGARLGYVGVVLAGHETVLALNREYLDHDYHTDVLSFTLGEPEVTGLVDGEVYVDLDTARERHAEFEASFEEEVRRYVVHGVLHLLGHDDATAEGKQAMHALEDRYLAAS